MNLTHNPALLGLVDDVSYWKCMTSKVRPHRFHSLAAIGKDEEGLKQATTPGSPTQRKSP
ncbi:hypothetical protein M514_17960 [Trichuris suis]|uniref:Uncharacterized protein n=1 Tax=Trichuris suis TaxID=68888 RepID=A0A085NK42_9BILA|nr:hypothetical protein M514_17960 [Trichuris suis]